MTYLDEYDEPTDDQIMWWNEANDHADDGDQDHDEPDDDQPNAYARAIAAGNYTTIKVCPDCFVLHCNGEYSPERPTDLPEPLSSIPADADLSAGMLAEHHAGGCTPEERPESGCDCETDTFSTTACDGCGDPHHGERHAMTLVYGVRP